MRAVIYARYSSDNQNEMSIEAQIRACKEYAIKRNLNINEVYIDEALSGTNSNRPDYQRMLADALEGSFDIILIHKYDRIARSLEEQVSLRSKLKKLNIKLIAVAQDYGEGKDAELSKGIQWVLGEYYSANLSEEVRKGHKEIALRGLHNGGYPPFGYDVVDQKYVINEKEAYFVRRMFELCISGEGYKELINEMASLGITGKRGKSIKYSQIYEILNNEKYTGTYLYCEKEITERSNRRTKNGAIRVENAIPSIISPELFEEARKIMVSRRHRGPKNKHRCSGLLVCRCGSKMHMYRSSSKGHAYEYFRCPSCGMSIKTEYVDDAVDSYLGKLLSKENSEAIVKAIENLTKYNLESKKEFEKDRAEKILAAERELRELASAVSSGEFKNSYEFIDKEISKRIKDIETLKASKYQGLKDLKIKKWIDSIKDKNSAPSAFIDRIEVDGSNLTIFSNFETAIKKPTTSLEEVVGFLGCGGTHNIFPKILYGISLNFKK